jgi:NitT/TauT family transport system ATP-binding protein
MNILQSDLTVPTPKSGAGLAARALNFAHDSAPVLTDINLAIAEGEFVCVLGPSGCGKTTLLRLLAGLEFPGAGSLSWNGNAIEGPSLERGVVFQDYSLFPWMSLRKNISLALAKAQPQMGKTWRLELADQYLEMVGLAGAGDKYPFELSGGMQQRGAIARTLALGSPVLLMDEPFGALDPVNRAKLQDLVLSVWAGVNPRKTVVFVTHDVEEALYLADRVIVLGAAPGRVIEEIQVPFERPRSRAALFGSRRFMDLREQIGERFRQDYIQRIEAESLVRDAEGI